MARYIHQGWSFDGNGKLIGGATIAVYLAGTTTAASIYTAATGGVAVNSTTSSTTDGSWYFYVDRDDYPHSQKFKIIITKSGFESKTIDNVVIFPLENLSWVDVSDYGAVGNGITDDTSAIQAAIDDVSITGGIVFFSPGIFKFTSIIIPESKSVSLLGSGQDKNLTYGTILYSTIRDGTTSAITLGDGGDDEAFHSIENVTITGGTSTEISGSKNIGFGDSLNNYCGLKIDGKHRGTIKDVTILGFDTYGLWVNNSYYWDISNVYTQYNGTGIKCVSANATNFYNCNSQYNIYGMTDIQSLFGGSVQGNYKSGIVYTENGLDSLLSRVWFESNNTDGTGTDNEADIWADNTNWQVVHVDSCRFSSSYATQTKLTHNFYVDNFILHVSGTTRFFPGNTTKAFYFKAGSIILDHIASTSARMGNIVDSSGDTAFYSFPGVVYMSTDLGTVGTLTPDSATPDVGRYNFWKTANTGATIISNFLGGWDGKKIIVLIKDSDTTFDFTGTDLKGNTGSDWSPSEGDWLEAWFDGSYWYCSCHDCTV